MRLEVAATAEVEEAEGGDEDNGLSGGEYLENDGVHDGRLEMIESFPPKRAREEPQRAHLLQPHHAHAAALALLPHQPLP